MQSTIIEEIDSITERTIVLLDGRQITVPLYRNFKLVNHDGIIYLLNFGIFDNKNPLHRALSNLVIDILIVHSISYTSTVLLALKKWFESKVSLDTSLGIECIDSLNNINISYLPFLIPLLRKLALNFRSLVSKDLIDFLENVDRWEERKPAYFRLIANDPEKGAFTLEELESLHSNLNIAFSNNDLSLSDYTLAWFFLATGVRPVQISRLKLKDVQIINKEVMINIPLVKGLGRVEQGYFLRKAPTILADCLIKYIEKNSNLDRDSPLFELNPDEVGKRIKKIFQNFDTYSSRLEGKIPVNAYRFRYTLATRALANGASDQEV